ncbi:MAG: hypothetical protein IPJ48_08380 [Propionivibrio sp.]|uniref:Uncharacterized protein n=1 Tax=Candidatus Propionivibrio dominans TaxID=2954373 RepID=A0A9D7FAX9_9RHOO|nr:hypothetical protein [Candidatus Propionivibrio dominans]
MLQFTGAEWNLTALAGETIAGTMITQRKKATKTGVTKVMQGFLLDPCGRKQNRSNSSFGK